MTGNQRVSRNKKNQKQNKNKPLKVVYISNPMKVKTTANRFRSLVQELTGKNSDISQIMDNYHNTNNGEFQKIDNCNAYYSMSMSEQCYRSLSSEDCGVAHASSNSFMGTVDHNCYDVFNSDQVAENQRLYNDPFHHQLDVLGSYEDLM